MKIINKFLNWLLLSSRNPSEASLTFKGVLIGFVPVIIGLLQLTNVAVSSTDVNTFINQSAVGVQDILYVVAAIVTAYGAIRKIYLTTEKRVSKPLTPPVQ